MWARRQQGWYGNWDSLAYPGETLPCRPGSARSLAVDQPSAGVDIPLVLADTVVDHTAVVDIAADHTVVAVVDIVVGHRLAAVVDIVADRKVAVGIVAGCTVVVVNSRVVRIGMDMAVVADTVEKIARVAYRQSEQVVLECLPQAACHNWNKNARQVRPVVHN